MERINVTDLMAKEDHWSKSRHAAVIHRERRSNPMCAHCFRRNCHSMDSTPIHGRKALKKSKIVNGPKRKLSPNFDMSSDDESEPAKPTEPDEDPEPADDRVI
jgi:hypothetical protein